MRARLRRPPSVVDTTWPSLRLWQAEITLAKKDALKVEQFFLQSGATSSYELLYQEGKSNLTEDSTRLFFFFLPDFPAKAFVPMALGFLGVSDAQFALSEVSYNDYLQEFERSFRAFALTKKTVLVPPWDADNPLITPKQKRLWLVPGMAFGTGRHATTQLMVQFIEKTVRPEDTVIDLGCGSGILALAALVWGCRRAFGIDIEELAVGSAQQNYQLNKTQNPDLGEAYFIQGDFSALDSIKTPAQHTVFLANLLPAIFYNNQRALKTALSSCRSWALSGIPQSEQAAFSHFLKQTTKTPFAVRKKAGWLVFYATNFAMPGNFTGSRR
ncbi:MAG: 50S ribosomal protein L11 methyltransferase [Turneriella sp.]|nr:50S ribosomal protein L11 methyltransferase [Turneriella sp.]